VIFSRSDHQGVLSRVFVVRHRVRFGWKKRAAWRSRARSENSCFATHSPAICAADHRFSLQRSPGHLGPGPSSTPVLAVLLRDKRPWCQTRSAGFRRERCTTARCLDCDVKQEILRSSEFSTGRARTNRASPSKREWDSSSLGLCCRYRWKNLLDIAVRNTLIGLGCLEHCSYLLPNIDRRCFDFHSSPKVGRISESAVQVPFMQRPTSVPRYFSETKEEQSCEP
jgi:hypothetical protein